MPPRHEDLVSRILAACRTDRAVTAAFSLGGEWALRSRGTEGMLIRVCTGEGYWIRPEGGGASRVEHGDIVLLPRGTPHTVSSAADPAIVRPFDDLLATHMVGAHGDHPIHFSLNAEPGATDPTTLLYSLHLWMPPLTDGIPLLGALPPVMLARAAASPVTTTLAAAMETLVRDSLAQKPGWRLSVARLADLLLVHVLGGQLDGADEPSKTTVLDDPGIARVVARMREVPEHPWTLAALADIALMSRTVFCGRFRARVGTTPIQYLASCRMARAAELLAVPGARVDEVALATGYESGKAFSRRFQRAMGMSVAQFMHARHNKLADAKSAASE